jgi:hypothetical protein
VLVLASPGWGSGWPPGLCPESFAHASAEDKPCLEVPADPDAYPRPGRPQARGRGRGRDVTPAPPTVQAQK